MGCSADEMSCYNSLEGDGGETLTRTWRSSPRWPAVDARCHLSWSLSRGSSRRWRPSRTPTLFRDRRLQPIFLIVWYKWHIWSDSQFHFHTYSNFSNHNKSQTCPRLKFPFQWLISFWPILKQLSNEFCWWLVLTDILQEPELGFRQPPDRDGVLRPRPDRRLS